MLALSIKPKISLKKIVVLTDFTPASKAALDHAIAIATHFGSKIILVHAAAAVPQHSFDQETGHREMHRLAEAEWRLVKEAEQCAETECERHLLTGTAPEVVEQFLALEGTELIVLGISGRNEFRKLLMKSGAEHIFRHVRCPVFVLGTSVRGEGRAWQPKRILLATDLQSDESKSVAYATALAEEYNARLILLHVTRPVGGAYPADSEVVVKPYYSSQLRGLVSGWHHGGSYGAEVWVEFHDDPITGIVTVANREAIDLLVLSVHPAVPLTLHFGHHAPRILAAVQCPTLIVQRDL